MDNQETYFLVTYRNPEKPISVENPSEEHITLKVKTIQDSNLGLSFIRMSDFIFETNGLIVDPKMDALKTRFEATKSLHLSIYNIVSIEEIGFEHSGLHFDKDKSNLLVLNNPSH